MIALFDIGGTNFRSAIYHNQILSNIEKTLTPNYTMGLSETEINNHILDKIYSFVIKNDKIYCIGVCFAGPISKSGIVWGSGVIYGNILKNKYNLKDLIIKKTNIKIVYVVNDLYAAALRYKNYYKNYLILTVSSGIGNKIVINRNVQIGDDGLEGEIGHIRAIDCDNININCDCGCGTNHIGSISSGRGIENIANKYKYSLFKNQYEKSILIKKQFISICDIAIAADNNDLFSIEIINYCTRPLAYVLCTILSSLYLEKIILMGGFAQNCNSYIKILKNNMLDFGVYNYNSEMILEKIVIGHNDDDHGLLGLIEYIKSNYILESIKC